MARIGKKRGVRGYEDVVKTKATRDTIQQFIDENLDASKIQDIYDDLEPKEKLSWIKDLLPYVLPKYQMVEYEADENEAESGIWGFQKMKIMDRLKKVG